MGAMVVAGGASLVKLITDKPDSKSFGEVFASSDGPVIVFGSVIATMALVALAGPVPKVASGLSVVTAMASVFNAGEPVIDRFNPAKRSASPSKGN